MPIKRVETIVLYKEVDGMNVNGITNSASVYNTSATAQTKESAAATKTETTKANETGVVYEPSNASKADTAQATKKYTPNTELVNKLKADAEARTAQLKSLVEKLISGQGNAIGTADDMWVILRKGDFTVDAATKAQAQADIAEDGYWGIEATSDRILDFAKALTGGDPSKIEEMRDAFKKGFEQATKTWGGELPEISQKTYEATMAKFDAWANEANGTSNVEATDMNGEV